MAVRWDEMDHLAILSRERGFLQKIISGEKTIESRWYKNKRTPFGTISSGDTVYFKESGKPVSSSAIVERVVFFDNLTPNKSRHIIARYGSEIGIDQSYVKKVKGKRFCTLILIKDVKAIKPFTINKKGYGTMSAWITVSDIKKIRVAD